MDFMKKIVWGETTLKIIICGGLEVVVVGGASEGKIGKGEN